MIYMDYDVGSVELELNLNDVYDSMSEADKEDLVELLQDDGYAQPSRPAISDFISDLDFSERAYALNVLMTNPDAITLDSVFADRLLVLLTEVLIHQRETRKETVND